MFNRIALAVLTLAVASFSQEPVLGKDSHRYRWVSDWGRLPDGRDLGNTHGCMVVDGKGRILVNTDTEKSVMIFSPAGELLESFGAEFKGGLHGMFLRREGDEEFLYLAHTARHEVVKTTLSGKVLWRIGVPKESGLYDDPKRYRPTAVVVGPDGRMYVADGYGLSWVHVYDRDRKYVKSFGGKGTEPGRMRVPHGLWLDTRGETPRLIVADRENHRLQIFDLDGNLLGIVSGIFRRPCSLYQEGDCLVVADLAGRVTILGRDNTLITHLGDNPEPGQRAKNGIPREKWRDGLFISPHSACWDRQGNLYVMDWLRLGRISKLERVKD